MKKKAFIFLFIILLIATIKEIRPFQFTGESTAFLNSTKSSQSEDLSKQTKNKWVTSFFKEVDDLKDCLYDQQCISKYQNTLSPYDDFHLRPPLLLLRQKFKELVANEDLLQKNSFQFFGHYMKLKSLLSIGDDRLQALLLTLLFALDIEKSCEEISFETLVGEGFIAFAILSKELCLTLNPLKVKIRKDINRSQIYQFISLIKRNIFSFEDLVELKESICNLTNGRQKRLIQKTIEKQFGEILCED